MHTIKLLLTYNLNISVQAENLSDCRIESNRENRFGSENRIESNRNFFCPNWNALVATLPCETLCQQNKPYIYHSTTAYFSDPPCILGRALLRWLRIFLAENVKHRFRVCLSVYFPVCPVSRLVSYCPKRSNDIRVGSAPGAASARFGPSVRGPIHLSHTMCVRVDAWYSLTTAVSYRMPEYCVPPLHCGTNSPVWMNGSHPTGKLLYCYLINFNLQYIRTKKQNNWTANTYATGQWTGYQKVAIL